MLERRLSEAETSRVRPFQRSSLIPQHRARQHKKVKRSRRSDSDLSIKPKLYERFLHPTTLHDCGFHDQDDLERDLEGILCGKRPRKVGEMPRRLGNFVRLCPATAAYRHALRLRQQVVRQSPCEDNSSWTKP